MTRKIPVLGFIPTVPNYSGAIVLGPSDDNPSGDWTKVFTPGTTFDVITATSRFSFSVKKPDGWNDQSASFRDGKTTVKVVQFVKDVEATNLVATNVSTFCLDVCGQDPIIIGPGQENQATPLALFGSNTSGWGEMVLQNFVDIAQNFASLSPPSNPLLGMFWLDLNNSTIKIWTGDGWRIVNDHLFAPADSFKHEQKNEQFSWTIKHNLSVKKPFIVNASFFVNTPKGIKPILPSDVEYVDANTINVSFSNAYTGYALIRP